MSWAAAGESLPLVLLSLPFALDTVFSSSVPLATGDNAFPGSPPLRLVDIILFTYNRRRELGPERESDWRHVRLCTHTCIPPSSSSKIYRHQYREQPALRSPPPPPATIAFTFTTTSPPLFQSLVQLAFSFSLIHTVRKHSGLFSTILRKHVKSLQRSPNLLSVRFPAPETRPLTHTYKCKPPYTP